MLHCAKPPPPMCSSLVSRKCMAEQEGTQEEKSKKVCSLSLPFLSSFLTLTFYWQIPSSCTLPRKEKIIWPKEPIFPSLPSQPLLRAKVNANFSKSLHSQEPLPPGFKPQAFPPCLFKAKNFWPSFNCWGHLFHI